jgi:hypothetical protein
MALTGANGKIVVAIDPAFRNLGWVKACIRDNRIQILNSGLFQTEAGESKKKRKSSDDLHAAMKIANMIRVITHGADIVISEIPSGTQSARASWTLGVTLGVLTNITKPLIEITPTMTKAAIAESKFATKQEMIEAAYKLHPELNWKFRKSKGKMVLINSNEHMADAVGVLYAGLGMKETKELLNVSSRQIFHKKSNSASEKFGSK